MHVTVSPSYSASSVFQSLTVTLGILDFVTKVSIIKYVCSKHEVPRKIHYFSYY